MELDDLVLNVASVSGRRKGLRHERDVVVESGHRSDSPDLFVWIDLRYGRGLGGKGTRWV
jgi:hypothetical protein